jgi:hypothetical protein
MPAPKRLLLDTDVVIQLLKNAVMSWNILSAYMNKALSFPFTYRDCRELCRRI